MNEPTSSSLSHDAAFAEIGALALGALSADEKRRVQAHVEGCAVCSAELVAMQRVVTQMPARVGGRGASLDVDASARIRERLVARASAQSRQSASGRLPDRRYGWLAIAAALVIIALGAGYYRERTERRELLAGAAKRDSMIAALSSVVRDRDAELAAITGPAVSVVQLSSTGVRPPTARMFWDRDTNKWTFFAHGLAKPGEGRVYELWLVTADKKIPAGTFTPAADGSAVVRATYALSQTDLKAIAVTEEPAGGVSAPTGAVILAGSAGS